MKAGVTHSLLGYSPPTIKEVEHSEGSSKRRSLWGEEGEEGEEGKEGDFRSGNRSDFFDF